MEQELNKLETRRRQLENENNSLLTSLHRLDKENTKLIRNNEIVAAQRDALHEVIRLACQVAMDKVQEPQFQ